MHGFIILERGESLQIICRASPTNDIPIQTKVRWFRHAAEGSLARYLTDQDTLLGSLFLYILVI
jgi:hypothetical protein